MKLRPVWALRSRVIFPITGLLALLLADTSMALPNPASVRCAELGGRLRIASGPAGETGFCRLPGGKTCEEWDLFRNGKAACKAVIQPAASQRR